MVQLTNLGCVYIYCYDLIGVVKRFKAGGLETIVTG